MLRSLEKSISDIYFDDGSFSSAAKENMEIIKDYCDNDKLKALFKFSLEMMCRKSMKERYHFGVWIGVLVLKKNMFDFEKVMDEFDKKIDMKDVMEYFYKRESQIELLRSYSNSCNEIPTR